MPINDPKILAQKILDATTTARGILKNRKIEQLTKEERTAFYKQIDEIEKANNDISKQFPQEVPKIKPIKGKVKLNSKERKAWLQEMNLEEDRIEEFLKYRDKIKKEKKEQTYTLYKTSEYGKISNKFVEKISFKLVKAYPKVFDKLKLDLRKSGIKVLSKTYVSMIIFSAILTFIVVTLATSLLFKHALLPVQVVRGFSLGLVGAAITAAIFYLYPTNAAGEREKKIQQDLPFAIIHMASVAGSGAKPISIFQTLLSSNEYPTLRDEIKKVVNYVNVFGYDLTTALGTVAASTSSLKFKDLLDGMISTISSGGDLKQYLQSRADEALTTYRLTRKKYVEVIATYSDIYTAILIAAPLLFFVTLAIIQMLGGEIGGLSVSLIANIGTYGVIPLLNVGYMVFLGVMQPK